FAKGTNYTDSDIDLAYFSEKELPAYERFILSNKLSQLAGREVDLVDIKEIDTVLAIKIFSEGMPIDIADENIFITQRIRAYRLYATLNEQRAPVIEAI